MTEAISGISPVIVPTGEYNSPAEREMPPRIESNEERVTPAAQAVESALRAQDPPLINREERLSILKDEKTGAFIYRSINRQTGEVVRQWPSESMLQFKAQIRSAEGVLFDTKV